MVATGRVARLAAAAGLRRRRVCIWENSGSSASPSAGTAARDEPASRNHARHGINTRPRLGLSRLGMDRARETAVNQFTRVFVLECYSLSRIRGSAMGDRLAERDDVKGYLDPRRPARRTSSRTLIGYGRTARRTVNDSTPQWKRVCLRPPALLKLG